MRTLFLKLFLGASAQQLGRSFNESCTDTNQEQRCTGICNDDFNSCFSQCATDDAKCKQLCNRDLTTCIDRCPCHDKCSWGCPCGFYQCSPPTNCDILPENADAFDKCGTACIMEADLVTGECMGEETHDEDYCYKKGNDAGIQCMKGCPCGDDCPNGCDGCTSHIASEVCNGGDISNQEQCGFIWKDEEASCHSDVSAQLQTCMNGCNSASNPSVCEDNCNADYVQHLDNCPCHTNCPNGCSCPPADTFGNQYCPTLPIADADCLTNPDYNDLATQCRDGCTNTAYLCVSKCYGDADCLQSCQDAEVYCFNHCPCYPQCPNGCPCYGWCENTPPPITVQCGSIWGTEAGNCEADRRSDKAACDNKCTTDPYPQQCEDQCATKYAVDLSNCPCHTNCANGCSCPLEDTLGNQYCPDGPRPDQDCLEDYLDESTQCRNQCTNDAFICSNGCAGDSNCLADCRAKENNCIYYCPCYDGCKYPQNPDCDPPLLDQCMAIWGNEARACEADRTSDLNTCSGTCNGDPICGDNCNQKYTDDMKDCPCHTDCANGCACPPEDTLGNSYCPSTPQPNGDCLKDYGDISKQCRDECTNEGYHCSLQCQNDDKCLSDCRLNENICVSFCPCYPECPLGCPCPGWCGGASPQDKCEAIWGEEENKCDSDCRTQRDQCINGCTTSPCEDECNRVYLDECSYYCPCHTYCQNGCSCPPSNDLGNSYCPDNPGKPNGDCLQNNADISKQCRDQCTNNAYDCTLLCYGDPDCLAVCRSDEIYCVEKCPCYDECPNGCPCPNWCGNPDNPSLNDKCDLIWGDEAQKCVDDCTDQRNTCLKGCSGDTLCEDKCNDVFLNQCTYYCPCHTYCPNGCPCYNSIGQNYCPGDNIPDPNCINQNGDLEKQCRDSCTDKSFDCIKVCECAGDQDLAECACHTQCQGDMLDCVEQCPCHEQCPSGCPCPIWCPATTQSTTTKQTTKPTSPPIATTGAPGFGPIKGDHLLILSRDGATVMGWPKGDVDAEFNELTKNYQDQNAHFDINGFWTHDACSVQVNGESYIIGGAYDCTQSYCSHVNVQRAVVKLSKTKCGLDIVMDGISKKLPYDMKEHVCSVFKKALNNRPDEDRAILCSPTDSADDVNTIKEYKDRSCWSSRDMITWESEPYLKWQHIKGTMAYHKGRVVIMGGTGLREESYEDHPYVEWLNQNGVYNQTDKTYGTWMAGQNLPLTLEEATAITDGNYVYLFGGLNFKSESCNIWQDTATCNSDLVYRNQDPTNGFQWLKYGNLVHPRSRHHSILMGSNNNSSPQLFHVAGYGKVTVSGGSLLNGRMVEKWYINTKRERKFKKKSSKDISFTSVNRQESSPSLYNYISPQSFVISDSWYNSYCI